MNKNKVVINRCYGGFGLSNEAVLWLSKEYGLEYAEYAWGSSRKKGYYLKEEIQRHDPRLVRCVETLGSRANGLCAELEIEEIYGNLYRISEYDGMETLYTQDTTEWTAIHHYANDSSEL